MLIRVNEDNTVVRILIDVDEQEFITKNPTGGFQVVDGLPFSEHQKWKLDNGAIIVDTEAEAIEEQKLRNRELRAYLGETDWLVIRHRDQLDAGIATSLSEAQFQELLTKRQDARDKVLS